MEITEKDLEDLIFDDALKGGFRLFDRGFTPFLIGMAIPNKIYWQRQVSLGSYGIADIIGYGRYQGCLHVDIIELKNKPLRSEDFDQVLRYQTAVREALINSRIKCDLKIRSYLVGPMVDSGHYIQNFLNIPIFTFKFNVDGFAFERHIGGWCRGGGELRLDEIKRSDVNVFVPEIQFHG
jgi:hypothetical protein